MNTFFMVFFNTTGVQGNSDCFVQQLCKKASSRLSSNNTIQFKKKNFFIQNRWNQFFFLRAFDRSVCFFCRRRVSRYLDLGGYRWLSIWLLSGVVQLHVSIREIDVVQFLLASILPASTEKNKQKKLLKTKNKNVRVTRGLYRVAIN